MAKIFRPYDIQGNNANVGWFDAQAYGAQAISEIKDPDGGTPLKDITSIPSPFARMDLVLTAFHEINKLIGDEEANHRLPEARLRELLTQGTGQRPTMYHRLVSEVFDVAEIFFNFEHLRDRFEIIVWDKNQDIDTNNPFGRTIQRFLDADSRAYNFDRMNRLYLLNYIGPDRPNQLNIVGATSPVTMFFPTANDMSYISRHVVFGNDRPFDHEYNPLYNRDFNLIKYLFAFRAANGQFAALFGELNTYLEYTYRVLNNNQRNELDAIDNTSIQAYDTIGVDEVQANVVEILGMPLHSKNVETNWSSDFYIKSSIYEGGDVPMVLPVESGNNYANWRYTTDKWGTTRTAPYKCGTPWRNRSLPDANCDYPYLTISDFLEDTIVRVPYELNEKCFYSGGYSCETKADDDKDSFLLPLTDTFFTFFTTKELIERNMITIKENVGGIKVLLRIPVSNGIIEYSRVYFEGQQPNAFENQGTVTETKIGLGIMPLVKFADKVAPHYRIAYFDKGRSDASISFFEGTSSMALEATSAKRSPKDLQGRGCSHEAYALEHNFDRIKVRINNSYNFIIPRFIEKGQGTKYTFAVDFGTTNTHIEYCTNNNPTPVPFKIEHNEVQMHKLHKNYIDSDIRGAFEQDFIPETVGAIINGGPADRYGFPMRTVFAERSGINYNTNPLPLCEGNIPFQYEHEPTPDWNVIKTELKWSGGGAEDDKRLALNIEALFILLRNKVIMGGGDITATKVVWFYPASMTPGKVNRFRRIWNNAYQRYFGGAAANLIDISESKAPVLNFQDVPENIITIDIGGGTTDVFVVEESADKMLLSFRFASNAIFGDAWRSTPAKNGFVKRYLANFEKVLADNGKKELLSALEQIKAQNKSTDIIAFLFSLTGRRTDNNSSLNFLQRLIDDDKMRYVFILFYGSIFYFIARAMKARGINKPQAICFSGNGSRTVDVLSTNPDSVAKFAKILFDDVYNDNRGIISVEREINPKTATCKGGIKAVTSGTNYKYDNSIETVVVGDNLDMTEECTLTYSKVDDNIKADVVNSVSQFISRLFELNDKYRNVLVNELDADANTLAFVKDYCLGEEGQQTLLDSIKKGVRDKRERDNVDDNTILEETLFFYPLVGLLHDLALKLSDK